MIFDESLLDLGRPRPTSANQSLGADVARGHALRMAFTFTTRSRTA
jgi:hypothetical protein